MKELFTVIISLFLVLGLIMLTYWVARALSAKGIVNGGRYFKVLDRVTLGREKQLVIVQIQGENYLIGISDHAIVLLEKWDADPENDQMVAVNPAFKDILANFKKKKDQEREL